MEKPQTLNNGNVTNGAARNGNGQFGKIEANGKNGKCEGIDRNGQNEEEDDVNFQIDDVTR